MKKNINNKENNIEEVLFHEQFKEDFIEYGIYAISDRAVPDVRDGLKPGQRRLIYGMSQLGATNKYMKSARITGDVMGKYHPHGDSALYESMTHMAQWWRSPTPLIDGDGNWGNVQGSEAAAARYTEAKLSKYGQRFVDKLKSGVVQYVPNYSNDLDEPTVLPIDFPYLLISGSTGTLTVAVNANMPPHNPREVMNAVIAYIKNPKISYEKLFELLPGPDFPTGGVIYNADEGIEYYKTGKFAFKLRGVTDINAKQVLITEIPFTLSGKVKSLQINIDDLIRSKRILNGTKADNFSNKDGIRIEVSLRKGDDVQQLEKELFAKTPLQGKYHATWIALDNRIPKTFDLKEYLSEYVSFQYELQENIANVNIQKLNKQLEISNGLYTALESIDVIIELIKNAKNERQILSCLTKGTVPDNTFKTKKSQTIASKFSFTENQAQYILETKLKRLSNLDKLKLERDIKKLNKEIEYFSKIISDQSFAKKELLKSQREVAKFFNSPEFDRKTKLVNEDDIKFVEEEKIIYYDLSIDKFGYVRLLPKSSTAVTNEVSRFPILSNERAGFFASDGNYYSIRVNNLKQSSVKDKGETLTNLTKLKSSTWPIIHSFSKLSQNNKYLTITKNGLIKLVKGNEYISSRTKLTGTKLKTGDEVVNVLLVDDSDTDLVIKTSYNRFKRLKMTDIPLLSRTASGNKSGTLLKDEKIMNIFIGNKNTKFDIGDSNIPFKSIPYSKLSTAFKAL